MSDLISRQDAIEAVIAEGRTVDSRYLESERIIHESDAVEALAMLQSAEAVQGWIPCSERLPEDSGNYLITVADLRLGHNGEHTVTMADFYAKAKKWNSVVDVYAWMPLPEPYKGGEDNE